jgi:hypothetical protein
MYLDGGVGDEYALFRPSVFSTIIRPALSDRNGWWVFASTPRGKNLFHKQYKTALANPDTHFSLELRASTSGILPQSELDDLRKDMDPEEYAQEYECSFDAALKGAIYAAEINQMFLDSRYLPSLFDPHLPTHVAFDLGFTDSTVAIYWQEHTDGTLRIVNTEATQGKDIFHHIERIHQFSAQADLGEVWLPHDARAKNLQTGRSMVEQFLESDIRPRIVPNHKVRDRLSAARKLFPRIRIDSENEGNEDLLEALKGYQREWDENKLMFSDTPLHNWCSDYADAFGYMCVVAAPKFGSVSALPPSSDMARKVPPHVAQLTASNFNLSTMFEDNESRSARVRRIT